MAGRLSITTRDMCRLRALTDPGQLDPSDQRLPRPLLQGLADLIGCDNVTYESHDLEARVVTNHVRLVSLDRTVDFANDDVQKSFWGLYHQGLCDYWPEPGTIPRRDACFANRSGRIGAAVRTPSGSAAWECAGRSRLPSHRKTA